MQEAQATISVATTTRSVFDYARLIAEQSSERLAADVVILNIRGSSDYTDYFIIATCENEHHIEALANHLMRLLRKMHIRPIRKEGTGTGGWVLLSVPDIEVHLMSRSQRDRYALEDLWSKAIPVLHIQ